MKLDLLKILQLLSWPRNSLLLRNLKVRYHVHKKKKKKKSHWTLLRASWIQSKQSMTIPPRCTLLLSSHLCLCHLSPYIPWGLLTKGLISHRRHAYYMSRPSPW